MTINARGRPATDRLVVPIAKRLARAGVTPNWLTLSGIVITVVGVAVILTGSALTGTVILALGVVLDAFDGAVARVLGRHSMVGSFYDSVTDRVGDAVMLGAATWIVRDRPLLFAAGIVALAGAQITSYIRAKAESLGWNATVGLIERPERVLVLLVGFGLHWEPLAVLVLALGSLVTITQRMLAVLNQANRGG